MKENIEKLLKSKMVSNYTISKITGIAQSTISGYVTGTNKIGNMKLDHAILLNDYYTKNWKEKVEEMENIKQIIEGIETGKIDLESLDPSYHEMEYVDGPKGVWIVHDAEGQEGLEVFFAEHEEVEELRQRIYEGDADESELEEMVHNEYADRFNYDDVVAYRVDGEDINWV